MKPVPVAEVFGPTVQGEGELQGVPCYFVRLGGCDFKCSWCDTPHAVLPEEVRQLERLDEKGIMERLQGLEGSARWVVVSGGNPCLHDLEDLMRTLKGAHRKIAVETQGTRAPAWLRHADSVCISPKPPSSGMNTNWAQVEKCLMACQEGRAFFKVVVFDDYDLEFALRVRIRFPGVPMFISAGNDAGRTVAAPKRQDERTVEQVREDLLDRSQRLVEKVLANHQLQDVRVQSQYHVLLWGNELGV